MLKVKSEQTRFWRLFSSFPLWSPLDYQLLWNYHSLSKNSTHKANPKQTDSPFPKLFEISQLEAEWEPDIPSGPLFPTASPLQTKFKNPLSQKLVQQQPASSFVTTELKWGKSSPEVFTSFNINII